MAEGYIKLFRSMQDWEWYSDPITKAVFLELLLSANYHDGRYKGQLIKRGQVVVGRKKLAEKLGISEQSVRTALNRLKSTNEITSKSTNKLTVITIENYEKYQGEAPAANQQINQQTNQQLTNNQPATNQQLTTSKKERRKRKEIIKEYIATRHERETVC